MFEVNLKQGEIEFICKNMTSWETLVVYVTQTKTKIKVKFSEKGFCQKDYKAFNR